MTNSKTDTVTGKIVVRFGQPAAWRASNGLEYSLVDYQAHGRLRVVDTNRPIFREIPVRTSGLFCDGSVSTPWLIERAIGAVTGNPSFGIARGDV